MAAGFRSLRANAIGAGLLPGLRFRRRSRRSDDEARLPLIRLSEFPEPPLQLPPDVILWQDALHVL